MERNGIKHILTSPYHPSSNGLAECAVQTFKNGIKKLEGDVQERISRFLFRYRVTPHSTTGLSPAELLMGRRLRTHLDLLHPDTSQKDIEKQDKLAKVTKRCRKFVVGDRLYARNYRGNNKWIPVIVTRILGPVSYQIQTSSGSIQCRCVDQLRYRHSLDSNGQ